MIHLRFSLDQKVVNSFSHKVVENLYSLDLFRTSSSFFVYVSMEKKKEVITHNLIAQLLKEKKTVFVPKINEDIMEVYSLQSLDDLEIGQYGILTTKSTEPYFGQIDLCLVPGLAFTEKGDRLGYGKGHYDRFISSHPETKFIGLAYSSQIVKNISTEEHDCKMDLIVTEEKVIKV